MKIKYESYDGKLFETAEACEKYEEENALPLMWDLDGNPTTDFVDKAYLIYFDSIEEIEHFLCYCAEIGVTTEGLTGSDGARNPDIKRGYYYFNTYYEEWLRIPNAFVNKNLKR